MRVYYYMICIVLFQIKIIYTGTLLLNICYVNVLRVNKLIQYKFGLNLMTQWILLCIFPVILQILHLKTISVSVPQCNYEWVLSTLTSTDWTTGMVSSNNIDPNSWQIKIHFLLSNSKKEKASANTHTTTLCVWVYKHAVQQHVTLWGKVLALRAN